jgi:hypothetical protein
MKIFASYVFKNSKGNEQINSASREKINIKEQGLFYLNLKKRK